jgi:branched-chain amino acid aminotransferase
MATGTNIRTWFEGRWHDGDVMIMRAADHGSWLGTTVFDGARYFEGIAPDLLAHCQRVNNSAEALMITPTVTAEDMVALTMEGLRAYAPDTAVYIRPMYWALEGGDLGVAPKRGATGFAICLEQIPMAAPDASTTLTTTRYRRPVLEDAVVNAKAGCLYPTTQGCWSRRGPRASATRWSPTHSATWPKPPPPTCSWCGMERSSPPSPTAPSWPASPAPRHIANLRADGHGARDGADLRRLPRRGRGVPVGQHDEGDAGDAVRRHPLSGGPGHAPGARAVLGLGA